MAQSNRQPASPAGYIGDVQRTSSRCIARSTYYRADICSCTNNDRMACSELLDGFI